MTPKTVRFAGRIGNLIDEIWSSADKLAVAQTVSAFGKSQVNKI